MFGAIIGDIIGSRFEFDNCKSKEFELFTNTCDYTDDTVMTLAVAKALLLYETITDMDAFKRELVRVMHEVGMPHPHCGYGGRFCTWMMKNDTEPYGSFGNGSAMRVSPVAWFAGSLDECEKTGGGHCRSDSQSPGGHQGRCGSGRSHLSGENGPLYGGDPGVYGAVLSHRFYFG